MIGSTSELCGLDRQSGFPTNACEKDAGDFGSVGIRIGSDEAFYFLLTKGKMWRWFRNGIVF